MVKALVFSKDRPLQLEGYLESLSFCTDLDPHRTHIIIPSEDHYRSLIQAHPDIHWHSESWFGGFDAALRYVTDRFLEPGDEVLFGCDDVVYTSPFNLYVAGERLRLDPQLLGFSLRLGLNIAAAPRYSQNGPLFAHWRWTESASRWGYPFEVMATLYRTELLHELLSDAPVGSLRTPNYLENHGVVYVCKHFKSTQPELAMYRSVGHAVGQDVNRVQMDFENPFQGTAEHEVSHLLEQFRQGYRLDWTNLFGIDPPDVFVNRMYWKLLSPSRPNAV